MGEEAWFLVLFCAALGLGKGRENGLNNCTI